MPASSAAGVYFGGPRPRGGLMIRARTEFEDFSEEDRRRCMVRFWLTTNTRRPLAGHFADYAGITVDYVPPTSSQVS